MDIVTIHQILWGLGIFFIGALVGYLFKIFKGNYEDIKNKQK